MSLRVDGNHAEFRRWVDGVYAAVAEQIGPAAGEHLDNGRYDNVLFAHSRAYSEPGQGRYVKFVIILTGKSLAPGRQREIAVDWTAQREPASIAARLVDVYADLGRDFLAKKV